MYRTLTFFLLFFSAHTAFASQHFLLIGSPGSGKGTFAQFLKQHGEYTHLAFGDLLRSEIQKNSDIGKIAKSYVEAGELVPNELMMALFKHHFLIAVEGNKNIIIDGLAQSLFNIYYFDEMVKEYQIENNINYVYLCIDSKTAYERLIYRMVCESCGYTSSIQKDNNEICPHCTGPLTKRLDDKNDTILKRIDRFFNSTIHLIEFYRNKPNFYEFDGKKDLKELYTDYSVFLDDN